MKSFKEKRKNRGNHFRKPYSTMKPDIHPQKAAVNIFRFTSILGTFFFFLNPLQGAGVAALKDQSFHNDSAAKPLVYSEMIDHGAPLVTFQVGGKKVTIERSKIAATVEVPTSVPNQILDETAIAPLRKSLNELTEFTNRFSQIRPLLSKHLDSLSSHVNNFDAGKIRYNAEWKSKQEYAIFLEAHEEQMRGFKDEEAKRQKEKIAFEAEQVAKGLTKHNGKWLDKDDLKKVLEVDHIQAERNRELQLALDHYETLKGIFTYRIISYENERITSESLENLKDGLASSVANFKKAKSDAQKLKCAGEVYKISAPLMSAPWSELLSEKDILAIYAKAGFTRDELGAIIGYYVAKVAP
jgi:hypothetical protein